MTRVGKYELVRKLATGGMAEVFLARFEWARGLEKTVVVKRILYHLAEDPTFIEMFFTEAQLAAQLSHPNIAQVIEFGESEGVYFLAMEYVDGLSLRALASAAHAAGTGIPFPHCARIAAFCCEALAYAHELPDTATGQPLNLVHRDISPDNVLISKTGSVKLVDFGIAKAATQTHRTKTGLVKGKLAYMAPEQLRAEPLDRRADIFSLGVMLYELVSGRKPYEAPSEVTLIHAMLYEEMTPLRARREDVPPELERIVNKALERKREDRWADCREMHAALEEYLLSTRQAVSALQIAELVAKYGLTQGHTEGTPPKPMATPNRPQPMARTPEPRRAERTPAAVVETAQIRQPRLRTGTDGSEATAPEREVPVVTQPRPLETTEVVPTPAPAVLPVPTMAAPPPAPATAAVPASVIAPSPPEKPAKRSPFPMRLAAAVLLLALGVGVGLWRWQRNSPEQPSQLAKPEEKAPGPVAMAPTVVPPTQPEQPPSSTPTKEPTLTTAPTKESTTRPPKPAPPRTSAPPPRAKPATPTAASSKAEVVAPSPTPAPPPPEAKQLGKVKIMSRPSSHVTIDGISRGDMPLPEIELEVGRHTAILECDRRDPQCEKVSKPTYTEEFDVPAGKTYQLKHFFQ